MTLDYVVVVEVSYLSLSAFSLNREACHGQVVKSARLKLWCLISRVLGLKATLGKGLRELKLLIVKIQASSLTEKFKANP